MHVDVIERGAIGCYYATSLHTRPHYDLLEGELRAHEAKADSRNIKWELHSASGHTKTILCGGTPYANGMDLEGLVSGLNISTILQEVVVKEHSKMVA